MFRAGFWLLILTVIATGLNAWVLWLNYVTARMSAVIAGGCQGAAACWSRDVAARSGFYLRIGAAIVIELIVLLLAYKVLGAVSSSRAKLRQRQAEVATQTPDSPAVSGSEEQR